MRGSWTSHSLLMEMEHGVTTLKAVWQFFFNKLATHLPYDQAIPLGGIYRREMKAVCPHEDVDADIHSSFA